MYKPHLVWEGERLVWDGAGAGVWEFPAESVGPSSERARFLLGLAMERGQCDLPLHLEDQLSHDKGLGDMTGARGLESGPTFRTGSADVSSELRPPSMMMPCASFPGHVLVAEDE